MLNITINWMKPIIVHNSKTGKDDEAVYIGINPVSKKFVIFLEEIETYLEFLNDGTFPDSYLRVFNKKEKEKCWAVTWRSIDNRIMGQICFSEKDVFKVVPYNSTRQVHAFERE